MLDLLATPARRRVLFACLYLSEGAPIGFIWWALPARLRSAGVPVEQITALTSLLILPWTLKFLLGPFVDVLRWPAWGRRHWIMAAQTMMGLTLLPLLGLDLAAQYGLVVACLLAHAISAAGQDVAIDALCIGTTTHDERGRINGWMNAGKLLGRACLGGGALVLAARIDDWFNADGLGEQVVVVLLIAVTMFSLVLVAMSREPEETAVHSPDEAATARASHEIRRGFRTFGRTLLLALKTPATWLGLLFAGASGAAFEGIGAVASPYLIDRGYSQEDVGWFLLVPAVGCMITGSILGGWLADRLGHRVTVAVGLTAIVAAAVTLANVDLAAAGAGGGGTDTLIPVALAAVYLALGLFVASSYALFMDLTDPKLGGTQFTAFMAATNGCEAWSARAMGAMVASWGYAPAMLLMAGVSTATIVIVPFLKRKHAAPDHEQSQQRQAEVGS